MMPVVGWYFPRNHITSKWEFNKLKYEWLIKMLSAYRENILILSEHVQILE